MKTAAGRRFKVDQLPLRGLARATGGGLAGADRPDRRAAHPGLGQVAGGARTARLIRFLDTAGATAGRPIPVDRGRIWTRSAAPTGHRRRQAYAWREIRERRPAVQVAAAAGRGARRGAGLPAPSAAPTAPPRPKPGYSDNELAPDGGRCPPRSRPASRDRLQQAEALLDRYQREPDALSQRGSCRAGLLAEIAGSGFVRSRPGGGRAADGAAAAAWPSSCSSPGGSGADAGAAGRTTGWNIETVKELPAEHRDPGRPGSGTAS